MGDELYEAVPNFSTAGDAAVQEAIAAALTGAGATLADVHADLDHNRSVFTVIGTRSQLEPAVVAAVAAAVKDIDLRSHAGVHPRVGACDVLPIVPLGGLDPRGGDLAGAVEIAREIARRIGHSLAVPALLYAAAATIASPGTAFAGALRRGGSDGLALRLASGELVPHAGPAVLHPTAGAVLVGAREVLVAWNVVLASDDLDAARAIASRVRERDGGLPGVRALGIAVDGGRAVQVSTNVERWREADPADVLAAVAQLARQRGLDVASVELVGLAPAAAFARIESAANELGVPISAPPNPTIESHLER